MIPNPILKVLSTLTTTQVQYLLMGGQACVLYGAAQFDRVTEIVTAIDAANIIALNAALTELRARKIAVPPFDVDFLRRGMAVHFRCEHPDAKNIRLDVMHIMRGVAPFAELWERRTTLEVSPGLMIELIAIPDLVLAKKTQRDKDWPMIRMLVESHYGRNMVSPNDDQIRFWLREARTPAILQAVAAKYPAILVECISTRPFLADIANTTVEKIDQALKDEEMRERDADRQYWAPLFKELEHLRHAK